MGILLDKAAVKKDVFRDPARKHKGEDKVESEETTNGFSQNCNF